MPVTKSAKKKLLQDKKKQKINKKIKDSIKLAIKKAKKTRSAKMMQEAVSLIDKSVKQHITHKNKAARLKSQLAKLPSKKSEITKESTKTKQKTASKVK